jgi:hypothetical protein
MDKLDETSLHEMRAHDVLKPHKMHGYCYEVAYFIIAIIFALGVVVVGVAMKNEECEDEPGPCFFNFLSHWYYIWFGVFFFIWFLARFSAFFRWITMEFHFFNIGTLWVWSILTGVLIATVTAGAIESKLPDDDNDTVGYKIIVLIALHFTPTVVYTFMVIPQYSEHLASFYAKRVGALGRNATYAAALFYLTLVMISPALFWIIYLLIFDPIDVYNVAPQYARDWSFALFGAAAVLVMTQIVAGYYLHKVARHLAAERLDARDKKEFPRRDNASKVVKSLNGQTVIHRQA